MNKMVIIINGNGSIGKDSMIDIISKYYDVMNISSIDPFVKIAMDNGWDGIKDEKSRMLLSDLKQAFVKFNDLPQKYIKDKYRKFRTTSDNIMFVHIREPEEIEKFKQIVGCDCVTLLVREGKRSKIKWNNPADDNVENYHYDFYYDNDKSKDEMEEDVYQFFRNYIFVRRQ